jgi:hypothetical protein
VYFILAILCIADSQFATLRATNGTKLFRRDLRYNVT